MAPRRSYPALADLPSFLAPGFRGASCLGSPCSLGCQPSIDSSINSLTLTTSQNGSSANRAPGVSRGSRAGAKRSNQPAAGKPTAELRKKNLC